MASSVGGGDAAVSQGHRAGGAAGAGVEEIGGHFMQPLTAMDFMQVN